MSDIYWTEYEDPASAFTLAFFAGELSICNDNNKQKTRYDPS